MGTETTVLAKCVFLFFSIVNCFNAANSQPPAVEEQLLQNTVQIISYVDGQYISGTGFGYSLKHLGSTEELIVTNRHVVENASTGWITFNESDSGVINYSKTFELSVEDFENYWIFHPDTTNDLAVLRQSVIKELALKDGRSIFLRNLSEELIPSASQWDSLLALSDVVMIGYPAGIIDISTNSPIARTGSIASHPKFDFNGKPEF